MSMSKKGIKIPAVLEDRPSPNGTASTVYPEIFQSFVANHLLAANHASAARNVFVSFTIKPSFCKTLTPTTI